jgi:KDO2-lipid IV(A) lauroyltransferase
MILLFKILAHLPLSILRRVGAAGGWLIWASSARYRAMMNQAWHLACASGRLSLAPGELARLKRRSIGQAGLLVAELPKLWCDPQSAPQAETRGLDEVLQAAQAGRGVILLTPHLGAFELAARVFALHHPITVLYRPAKQRGLRRLMETLRPAPNLATAPANAAGVRRLLRALRQGQAIGMLPDQVPANGDGVWAPFFGRPAYTMVLPIRLAQTTKAPIFWVRAIRTTTGWTVEFESWAPDPGIEVGTIEQAVLAMNRALEAQILQAPEQYLWPYNRYKTPRGVLTSEEARRP